MTPARSLSAALAAGVTAATIAGCGISDPYAQNTISSTAATSTATSTTPTTGPTGPTPTTTTPAPAAGGSVPGLSPAQAADVQRAKRAVRCFLRGYLPYSYGLGKASRIRCVTARLRHELAASPPHTAPNRRARPRVTAVRLVERLTTRAYLSAQVDDGRLVYAVSVTVAKRGGAWRVSELS